VAPLGKTDEPSSPFEVTSMDITGPYLVTPRKNKYLLTFIDHVSKWAEAYPIPGITAEPLQECTPLRSLLDMTQDPL